MNQPRRNGETDMYGIDTYYLSEAIAATLLAVVVTLAVGLSLLGLRR